MLVFSVRFTFLKKPNQSKHLGLYSSTGNDICKIKSWPITNTMDFWCLSWILLCHKLLRLCLVIMVSYLLYDSAIGNTFQWGPKRTTYVRSRSQDARTFSCLCKAACIHTAKGKPNMMLIIFF